MQQHQEDHGRMSCNIEMVVSMHHWITMIVQKKLGRIVCSFKKLEKKMRGGRGRGKEGLLRKERGETTTRCDKSSWNGTYNFSTSTSTSDTSFFTERR